MHIDHKAGETLWRHEYVTAFDCNIATPLSYQGKVFISSGENHGSELLSVQGGDGKMKVGSVWDSQGSQSTLSKPRNANDQRISKNES